MVFSNFKNKNHSKHKNNFKTQTEERFENSKDEETKRRIDDNELLGFGKDQSSGLEI